MKKDDFFYYLSIGVASAAIALNLIAIVFKIIM